jgi:adenine/guanine phosphoribosyltransferase-like PRPP-binding protein
MSCKTWRRKQVVALAAEALVVVNAVASAVGPVVVKREGDSGHLTGNDAAHAASMLPRVVVDLDALKKGDVALVVGLAVARQIQNSLWNAHLNLMRIRMES